MQKAIYTIIDKTNKRVYVGETTNFEKRYLKHIEQLKNGSHYNKRLQELYNEENYEVDIEIILSDSINLHTTLNKVLLLLLEKETINKYKRLGYEILNKEDSLEKFIKGEKKLFSDDAMPIPTEKAIKMVRTVMDRRKSYKQVDIFLYQPRSVIDSKSKRDISESIRLLEQED